jgi:uncharacterized protein
MNFVRKRVVIDTSSLISALLKPLSIPAQALAFLGSHCDLMASVETLAELENVLGRSYLDRYRSREERADFIEKYREMVNVIEVLEEVQDCRDPKDDKFLSLALAAKIDLIVSSDADLQVLNPYRGIPVLSPVQVMGLVH